MNVLDSLKLITKDRILTSKDDLLNYGRDWTRYYTPNPLAILFPISTVEVQEIVLWARKNKISIVPSGGRTGLSGAAVAQNGEVVVSLSKMNKILDLNTIDNTLLCEAGCITEEIQNYAAENNLFFPVDFAARGSSQIGGNVATNVGGLNVIRYGLMRDWVVGLEVVTGCGEILSLNKALIKNTTGYDFRHLFIGSEGTLGIITKVFLRLTQPPKSSSVLILGLNDPQKITDVFQIFRSELALSAYEFFTQSAMEYVLKLHSELPPPFLSSYPFYILIEAETHSDEKKELCLRAFESCLEKNYIFDGVISQTEQQAENFWKYRDFISESLAPYTPYKNDISVRISRVTPFMLECDSILKKEYPNYSVVWFGHIGDGNLHINILKPSNIDMSEFVKTCQSVDKLLFETIQKFEGSISAEHGVGLSKKPFLSYTRSLPEIEHMKAIKKVFDPDCILNPGKIFDY